jgi:hypothetical protein
MTATYQTRVNDLQGEGWEVADEDDERVILERRSIGSFGMHFLVFALTFYTAGFVNVLYALKRYYIDGEKKVIYKDEEREARA